MGLLTDKTAAVTGGSSGIGLATAQRFVDEGATVIITGRCRTELDAAATKLGSHAHGHAPLPQRPRISERPIFGDHFPDQATWPITMKLVSAPVIPMTITSKGSSVWNKPIFASALSIPICRSLAAGRF